MEADVAGSCRKHTLTAFQHGTDNHRVRLGSSHKEINIPVGTAAGLAYFIFGGLAVLIPAVAGQLFHIGFRQSFQNGLVSPFTIIVFKI